VILTLLGGDVPEGIPGRFRGKGAAGFRPEILPCTPLRRRGWRPFVKPDPGGAAGPFPTRGEAVPQSA